MSQSTVDYMYKSQRASDLQIHKFSYHHASVACAFCRYGNLDKGQWPYWSVGALSQSNVFYSAGPINGCG